MAKKEEEEKKNIKKPQASQGIFGRFENNTTQLVNSSVKKMYSWTLPLPLSPWL